MKINSLLLVLFIGLMPFLSYSYPVYMSVYQNKNANHAILLWGDMHAIDATDENETQFLNVVRPHLNALLSNQISCEMSVEIHEESIFNTMREIKEGLKTHEELSFLQRLSIIGSQLPSQFINSWLGVDKPYVPFYAGDNRTKAIFSFNVIHRNSLSSAAEQAVNELLSVLSNVKNAINIERIYAAIEGLEALQIIDKIFFDPIFVNELASYVTIDYIRRLFINYFIEYSKILSVQEYSIHDLVKQVRYYYFYCFQKNENSNSDKEKAIWAEVCGMLTWIDEVITETFKPATVAWDTPLTTCFINKAYELQSFYALSPQYQLSEKDEQEENAIYKIKNISHVLIEYFPNGWFLDQALTAAMNNKHFVCIAGADHCVTLGEWLESLGYSKTVECNYSNEEQMLSSQEIDTIFNSFVSVAQ